MPNILTAVIAPVDVPGTVIDGAENWVMTGCSSGCMYVAAVVRPVKEAQARVLWLAIADRTTHELKTSLV